MIDAAVFYAPQLLFVGVLALALGVSWLAYKSRHRR